MLRFSFTVKNPWAKDVYCKSFEYNAVLHGNKHFEAEHYYCNYNLFHFSLDLSWRGEDHAGPELELTLLGFSMRYKIYDVRHWDYSVGRWVIYVPNVKNKKKK